MPNLLEDSESKAKSLKAAPPQNFFNFFLWYNIAMWKDKFPREGIYFETSGGILYRGDCLEVMKEFPRESIDLVLADPPYNIRKNYGEYKDDKKDNDFYIWIESVFSCFNYLLKMKSHLTFTCAQKQIWFYKPMLERHGFFI